MTSIIITLLIVLYRIPLINLLGDRGMGYYSVALEIYLLFMTVISYGLPKAISELIAGYRSKGQYCYLQKSIQSAMIFALMSSGLSAIFLFVFADGIAIYFMNASYSAWVIRVFALCLIPVTLLGALHGVFSGTKLIAFSKKLSKLEEFLVAVLSLFSVYFFSKYGSEIAVHKDDPLIEDTFRAVGAAVGLTFGVFVVCIIALFHFKKVVKKVNRLAQKENEKISDKKSTIIHTLVMMMLPFVCTLIIYHLSNLIDYAVFNRIMSVQGHKESSYMILLGMFNGKYEFFISIPLLILNCYAISNVPALKKIAQDGNRKKMQIRSAQCFRNAMLCIIPCTFFYIVFSNPLMELIFDGNNETSSVLLRIGAVSIIFYSLAGISNAVLNAIDDWITVTKNAFISLIIQLILLLVMMIVFQWGILALVMSRIIFSASLFILNEHALRDRTGFIMEHKRTFNIPITASLIMSVFSLIIYVIAGLFPLDKVSVIIAVLIGIPVYIIALVFLGGITPAEMYRLPGGKYLAPLCRKLHLIK